MKPVLSPPEMAQVDSEAPEPADVLVGRAGFSVAVSARRMLRGCYGRRVVVVAGRGNNGADGRVAAGVLRSWGVRVAVTDPGDRADASLLAGSDLIVDAAYGTGLSRPYQPPWQGTVPVLAVDIPSGLSGFTGLGESMLAARTVTFAAYKPGLLLGDGPERCGEVSLAGIGLEGLSADFARSWLVESSDMGCIPVRSRSSHKWNSAVMVIGGSPAMMGAPILCSHSAMRAGAGYALLGVPGADLAAGAGVVEQVRITLDGVGWVATAAAAAKRVKAMVVGPGLGDAASGGAGGGGGGGVGSASPVADLLRRTDVPAVVDADALNALGSLQVVGDISRSRGAPLVLTPHDMEYRRLSGHAPQADRIADVREAAIKSGSVVLLKGPTTVVGAPDGRVALCAEGRPSLATAGSGDVLSGIVAAFLARGMEAWFAASVAAFVHGSAARRGLSEGLVASDLPGLVAAELSQASGRPGMP